MPHINPLPICILEPVYSDEHKILGCISYASNDDREGVFKASRAWGVFLVIAMTLSLLMVNLMILFLTDYDTRRFFLIVIRVLFLSAFVCNLFMFMIFAMQECDSDGIKCIPGGAGIVACFNAVVLLALCVLILITPPPKNPTFLPIWNIPQEKHDVSVRGPDEELPRSSSRSKRFINADSSSRPSSRRNLSPPPSPVKGTDPPESPIKSKRPNCPKMTKSPLASPKNSRKSPPESPKKSKTSASPKKAKGTKTVKSPTASPRKTSSSGSPDKVKKSSTSPKKSKSKKQPDPSKSTEKAPVEKVVEVEQIPNGRKITTTVTHPDGSKTITYKIEDLDTDDDTVKR